MTRRHNYITSTEELALDSNLEEYISTSELAEHIRYGGNFTLNIARKPGNARFPDLFCTQELLDSEQKSKSISLSSTLTTAMPAQKISQLTSEMYETPLAIDQQSNLLIARLGTEENTQDFTHTIHAPEENEARGSICIVHDPSENSVSICADFADSSALPDVDQKIDLVRRTTEVWRGFFSELLANEEPSNYSLSISPAEPTQPDQPSAPFARELSLDAPLAGLESIGGLTGAKKKLREIAKCLDTPSDVRELLQLHNMPIFLYGNPGTGKSALLDAFGEELNCVYKTYQSSQESPANWLNKIIRNAASQPNKRYLAHVNLPAATNINHELARQLSQQFENASTYRNLIVAIESRVIPGELQLDGGAFEHIQVTSPNINERADIFFVLMKGDHPNGKGLEIYDLDNINLLEISKKCPEGATGADIKHILDRARSTKATQYNETGRLTPISQAELEAAIAVHHASLC